MLIGFILAGVSQYTDFLNSPLSSGLLDSAIGFIAGGGSFWLIIILYYLLTKKHGMGMGDVKYMAMIGSILGWQCLPMTVFAGSILGSIIGIMVMIVAKSGRHTEIPLALARNG